MKIITLVPVKNENWILRFSLLNFSIFSDEIIILDDSSNEDMKGFAVEFPLVTIIPFNIKEEHVDMSLRRNILLSEGRKRGGTHFIMLDADEIFSHQFALTCRKHIADMKPGQILLLPWILIGENKSGFIFDVKQENNFKDFIFCDDSESVYGQQFLSEPRTPGKQLDRKTIPFKEGAVYHFQNIAQKRNQYKQAWYRVNELIKGERSARKINATYDYTKHLSIRNPSLIKDSFVAAYVDRIAKDAGYYFYLDRLKQLFTEYGISFFEPLDIWHIEELKNLFIEQAGKVPKPSVFPCWILYLNTVKNKLINAILFKYSLLRKLSK